MKNVRTSGMKSPMKWELLVTNYDCMKCHIRSFYRVSVAFWFFGEIRVRVKSQGWDLVRCFRFWRLVSMLGNHRIILGGGFKYFVFAPGKLGKISSVTHVFQWVETTNQYRIGKGYYHLFEDMPTKNSWFGPGGRFEPIVLNGGTKTALEIAAAVVEEVHEMATNIYKVCWRVGPVTSEKPKEEESATMYHEEIRVRWSLESTRKSSTSEN